MFQLKVYLFIVMMWSISDCYIIKKFAKRGLYGSDLNNYYGSYSTIGNNYVSGTRNIFENTNRKPHGGVYIMNHGGSTYMGRTLQDVLGAGLKGTYVPIEDSSNTYKTINPILIPMNQQHFSLPMQKTLQFQVMNPYNLATSAKIPYQLPSVATTIAPPMDFTKSYNPFVSKPLTTTSYSNTNALSLNQPLTMVYSMPKVLPYTQFPMSQALPLKAPQQLMIPITSPVYMNKRNDGFSTYRNPYVNKYSEYKENNENAFENDDYLPQNEDYYRKGSKYHSQSVNNDNDDNSSNYH